MLWNEKEFSDWFEQFYFLFGFKRIVHIGRAFPDCTVESMSGKTLKVELEYDASNARMHKGDYRLCDLIVSYLKRDGVNRVLDMPVLSVFEVPTVSPPRNRSIMMDRNLTAHFVKLLDSIGSLLIDVFPMHSSLQNSP